MIEAANLATYKRYSPKMQIKTLLSNKYWILNRITIIQNKALISLLEQTKNTMCLSA